MEGRVCGGGADGDAECLVSCSVVVRACEKLRAAGWRGKPKGRGGVGTEHVVGTWTWPRSA